MAETLKILGQLDPGATLTALYTVPADTSVTSSTLAICNQNSSPVTIRVVVSQGGEALATKQYLFYDYKLFKNDSCFYTIGLTLAATDVVKVYASSSNVSFQLFGVEVT